MGRVALPPIQNNEDDNKYHPQYQKHQQHKQHHNHNHQHSTNKKTVCLCNAKLTKLLHSIKKHRSICCHKSYDLFIFHCKNNKLI